VAIKKHGGLAGRFERFRIDQGMEIRGNDFNRFKSCRAKVVGNPASAPLDVGFVLAFGADAGDTKKFTQLREVLVAA
jgi:hypothetical protein